MGNSLEASPTRRPAALVRTWLCLVACLFIGMTCVKSSPRDAWYESLPKSSWMVSRWTFDVVCVLLAMLMGWALSLLLARGRGASGVGRGVTLSVIVAALCFVWCQLFFRFHAVGGALTVIVALWLLIGLTVAAFWSVRDVAGALLLPCWLWATVVVMSNAAIYTAQ